MCGGGTQTTTTKTEIPPEVLARYNAVNARAEEAAKTPFQPYTGEFVAPLTQTQQAGVAATNQYAQTAQPYFGAGAGLTMQGARSVGPLTQGQIGYYQNPYTQYVAGATQAALQQQQGQQLSQQQADAIRGGAFGGDRAGLQRAVLQGQQGLATAQALAPIYSQGYQQAVQTAQGQQGVVSQDLARQLQAGQQIAGLGTGAQAAALQGAQAQMQAGTLEQQTQQAKDTAQYQQFLQQRGYDFQTAQFLANIAMGTGALSGNTQTQTAPASFFSDKRLKHDAERVGEMHDGTPIYRFKYNGSDHTQIGLMAQDVEKRHPEAVGESQGYKTVDYKKATDEAAHKADGGGIMPSWMGGAVANPGHYAAGGLADADLSALLAQQSKSFGPFGQGGLYGGSAQANPYSAQGGGQAGYVPAGSLHVPKMLQASSMPAPKQTSTASELYSNLKSLDSIASDVTGKGLFQRGRDATGMGEQSKPAQGTTQNQTASTQKQEEVNRPAEARGGLVPRGHYNSGGVGVVIPGQPDEQSNPGSESGAQGDVLAKVVKEGSQEAPKSLPQPGQSAPTPQQGPNPLGLAASGISAAKGIGSIGSGISSLASGLGAGAGAAGTAAGAAGAAGTAAGAAGAAGGIGSALGSIGTGIAQVLPFLAMLSDERTKHNKREVGKLYDGQPVYSFDYGDGRTQIGLMAQHVERKHPEAVAETDGGLKMVDYHRATEHAAEKGHFEQGGLARAGFVAGGPTDETTAPEPDYQAIADYQIAKESRGNPLARATTSSAAGLGQFTDSTAREVLRRNPDLVQGIEYDPTQRGFAATLPENVQRGMALAHARQQAQVLKEQGFEPTKENVRMNWFLGEAGGPAFLRGLKDNPNAPAYTLAGQDQVRANQSVFFKNDGTPRTAQELFDLQTKGIGGGGPTRAGGVMGALRDAGSSVSGAAKDTGSFLSRNKDIILPVLQGLGAMAGSKSRFLGSAILEGLGAGAKSYSDLQQQTAQTEGTQATTAGTQASTASTLSNIAKTAFVYGPNGQLNGVRVYINGKLAVIPPTEYFKNPKGYDLAPSLASEAQGIAKTNQGAATETGQGAAGENQPARQETITGEGGPKAPAAPQSPYRGLSQQDIDLVTRNAANAQTSNPTVLRTDPDANPFAQAQTAAVGSAGTREKSLSYAKSLSEIPAKGPVSANEFSAAIATPAIEYVNGLIHTLGGGFQIADPKDLANVQNIRKLEGLRAQAQTSVAGQRAYAALERAMSTVPTQANTPEGAALLFSDILQSEQTPMDYYRHLNMMRDYALKNNLVTGQDQANLIGTGSYQNFMDRYANQQAAEKKALQELFLLPVTYKDANGKSQTTSAMSYLISYNGNPPPAIRKMYEEKYGPEIFRYFDRSGRG
jgi:hypothetical protein